MRIRLSSVAVACTILSLASCHLCRPALADSQSAPSDSPVSVKYVWTDMRMYAPSNPIKVTAWIGSTVPVTRVTADGTDLIQISGLLWEGMIPAATAMGEHSILVQAYYDGGSAQNASCVYKTVNAVALSTSSLLSPTAATAKDAFLFTVCGQAAVKDSTSFFVSDGSSAPVEVRCNNHNLVTGDIVRARGEWHPGPSPYLTSRAIDIRTY